MPTGIVKSLDTAELLLESEKYNGVIQIIEDLDYKNAMPEYLARARLISAIAKIELGDYQVEKYLKEAVSYFQKGADHVSFAVAKYYLGSCLANAGDFANAKSELIEAFVSFKRGEDQYGQAKSLNRLAYLEKHTGNICGRSDRRERMI